MIPAKVAQMYHCLPVAVNNGAVQVALADPLDPARADEIHFAIKRDVQIVVADPAEINKAVDRLYGQEEASGDFGEILQELGADSDIAREVDEATGNAQRLDGSRQRGADCEIRQPRPATGHSRPRERHPLRTV